MTLPWFFDDAAVDHAALEWLAAVARRSAATLGDVHGERLRDAATHLARCAGPFADDLADAVLRTAADEAVLADRCLQLARLAADAAAAARIEQARRVDLRDAFTAELRRDRQRAALTGGAGVGGAGGADGTSGGGTGW